MVEQLAENYLKETELKSNKGKKQQHRYKAVYLIIGLKADFKRIRLSNDTRARKASLKELERFRDQIKYNGVSEYNLVIEFEYASDAVGASQYVFDFSARINFIFKLVSSGKICLPKSIKYIVNPRNKKCVSAGLYTDNGIKEFTSESLFLNRTQILGLSSTWKKFIQADNEKNKAFHIAWTRYLFTQRKSNVEDRLIDCMIALEALFLKSDETEGTTYRLAIRVTYFLRNEFIMQQLNEFMKKSYHLRSRVIHGSNTKENVIRLGERVLNIKSVVDQLVLILEIVLKKYISKFHCFSIEHFIDRIDLGILDSFKKS